jgi:hypothetical protein
VAGNRYRVINGLREKEMKHCASNERRCKMRREIVVDE